MTPPGQRTWRYPESRNWDFGPRCGIGILLAMRGLALLVLLAQDQIPPPVEQKTPGTKPGIRLVESIDGLGIGFVGPQGSGRGRNPSDNSLAVGPDHIMQTVNGRGIAIFAKRGTRFDTTGKVLYGPVPANILFRGFTGNCEQRTSGDVVVRYGQLANRWLVVMPLFSRGAPRPDQPTPFGPDQGGGEPRVVGVHRLPATSFFSSSFRPAFRLSKCMIVLKTSE